MRSILQHFNILIRFFVRSKSNWAVQQTLCKQSEISPPPPPLLMGTATPPAAAAPLHTWQNLRLSTAAAKYFAVHLMMRKVLCCNGDLDGACPIHPPPTFHFSLCSTPFYPSLFAVSLHSALYVAAGNNFALKSIATEGTCRLMRHMRERARQRGGAGEKERGGEREGDRESCCVCFNISMKLKIN